MSKPFLSCSYDCYVEIHCGSQSCAIRGLCFLFLSPKFPQHASFKFQETEFRDLSAQERGSQYGLASSCISKEVLGSLATSKNARQDVRTLNARLTPSPKPKP